MSRLSEQQLVEILIGGFQQDFERGLFDGRKRRVLRAQKPLQHDIKLQQAATTFPAEARKIAHNTRFVKRVLILPIAAVGSSCLGHTSTQFIMVWQRNNR